MKKNKKLAKISFRQTSDPKGEIERRISNAFNVLFEATERKIKERGNKKDHQ